MIPSISLCYLDIYLILKEIPIRHNIKKEKHISNIIITSILGGI
jgi:hypothetical protein